ncbi:transposable element Tcb2 transposase [Trichonephila clavipes]|nr:transposable element Tcb2 transposase [Trichonephila clavipes]
MEHTRTNEAHFHLNRPMNSHNCCFWVTESRHVTMHAKALHDTKVTVWSGFTASFILGRYFFERGTPQGLTTCPFNRKRYCEMLQTYVILTLQKRDCLQETILNDEGAPPHIVSFFSLDPDSKLQGPSSTVLVLRQRVVVFNHGQRTKSRHLNWNSHLSTQARRPVPGRPRATTPAEDRFLALSARRRRTTTVPQLVADHFQASGRRISATTVRNRLHNAGLYARRPVVCVPLNERQRRNRLCWAREHVSWTQQQWASVLFTDESRFTMESDSGRLLIWREQRTRYHQSNTVERHSYRCGGILVWAGISLGGHTDLHVFHGGTVTGLRYRDETLDPYVRPYAAAIGNDFILMDDNARPHRARIVEEYLEDHGLERMEWPARSLALNPIEHLCDYLGREVAALNPPPRSLHELKQGLLCVWSSLPIPVSDNLINSMGNRCRQCIQVKGGHIPY